MKYHKTLVGTKNYMAKEIIEENEYDQKVDVYSMGVSFYEMCYFHIPKRVIKSRDNNGDTIYNFVKIQKLEDQNVHYSQELLNIIDLMLEEDKDKRKTSREIFDMIKKQYSLKYLKSTSIDSIIRCLYSFDSMTSNFLKLHINLNEKPVTKAYIECLNSLPKTFNEWNDSINNLRQIIASENPKLQGSKEIDPRFVFAFLLKELHKELNNPKNLKNQNSNHLIISGEESSKTSKVEVMLKFVNDIYNKFNSPISNMFLGLMKKTNYCFQCKIITYSFSSFFFITFKLEHILKKNNIQVLDIEGQIAKQNYLWLEVFFHRGK